MGLLEDCKHYFGTDNLYSVLSVKENANEAELKKAYKKRSLLVHPDRVDNCDKENATRKFQVLAKVHSILSNAEQRDIYDDTGEVDEENAISEDRDYFEYWRLLFPRITTKDIDAYMKKYKGSAEEIKDLMSCYVTCKGDMDLMCEHIIGYEFDEEDRYREILTKLIEEEEIPNFTAFTKETKTKRNKRKRKFSREAAEAEDLKRELNIDKEEESLEMAIMKRASERKANFDSMIANLEEKYGNPKNSKQRRSRKK